jgi:parvulin-like peptidyl-prolyl isomerase
MSLDQIVALQIEGQSYSLAKVLRSAIMQDRFQAMDDYLTDVLITAYAEEQGITASQEDIQAAVVDWRVAKEQYQASDTQRWLDERSLSVADLAEYARMTVIRERVRRHVASGQIERQFAEQRSQFEAVALSQIVVNDRGLARELKFRAQEGADFFRLARQYSVDEASRMAGGYIGRLERRQLPRLLAAQAFGSAPGTIAGPIEIDKRYYVMLIEDVYPAELNADIRARLEQSLFEEWLASRRKSVQARSRLWEEV